MVSIANKSLSAVDCLVEGNIFGKSIECSNKQHLYLRFTFEKNHPFAERNALMTRNKLLIIAENCVLFSVSLFLIYRPSRHLPAQS